MIFSFQNASFRDSETGLYNQAYFMEVLNREWHRLIRDQAALSILFLNPHINLNSKIEKQCFIEIAHILKKLTYRSTDIICRFDDKFFAIGLFDLNEQGTQVIIERIQNSISETNILQHKVNLSVGGTHVLPSATIEIEQVFCQTAENLDQADHSGLNCCTVKELH